MPTRREREEFAELMGRLLSDWLFPQALYRLSKEGDWPRREALIEACLADMGTPGATAMRQLIGACQPLVAFYGAGSYNPYADQYEDELRDQSRAVSGSFVDDLRRYLAPANYGDAEG